MTTLREIRLATGRSQRVFAALLGMPIETYRPFDSGRRAAGTALLDRAEQLLNQHRRDSDLFTLDSLAGEFDIHPRTLRAAARDGRLQVHLSTKSVFGRPLRLATRSAMDAFVRVHYRQRYSRFAPVAILPQTPKGGVGTTSLWFVSLRGEESFEVCNQACSVGPRSFLITAPFAWTSNAKWLFVNLVHFGMNTPRTVVLPYRSDASPQTLWPKGLRFERDLVANPGAAIINTGNTIPTAGRDVYLSSRTSTQSNLYRVRIPD